MSTRGEAPSGERPGRFSGGPALPPWSLPILIGLLGAAVYAGSLSNGFTFDDAHIVTGNRLVTRSGGAWRLWTTHYWAGQDATGDLYRPLTVATYRANHRLWGAGPGSFHAVNVLLHAVMTGLCFALFRRLGGPAAAAAGAILFAVHPIHAEAVASVVGRAELLAGAFVMGGWLCRARPWASGALMLCGLLSKESAIVLPGLMLLEDAALGGRPHARKYLPHAVALALYVAARELVLAGQVGVLAGPFLETPAHQRAMTGVMALGRYLWLMIWPARLSADYSFNQVRIVESAWDPALAAAAVGVSALGALGWAVRRRSPAATVGLEGFLLALLPVSNLVIGIGVIMAERLLYLPSAGLCLAAGIGIEALAAMAMPGLHRRNSLAACCLLAAAPAAVLAGRAALRTADWRDDLTLFTATVRDAPKSALAHFGLATALADAGRLSEAELEYGRALAIRPAHPGLLYSLGVLQQRMGRPEEAARSYESAIEVHPGDWRAMTNLAVLLMERGEPGRAEALLRGAAGIEPLSAEPRFHLGRVLESAGRLPEAIASYRDAVRIEPEDLGLLTTYGRALLAAGQAREAVQLLERAVTLKDDAPHASAQLAAALLAAGERDRARSLAASVLRRHPDLEIARRVLAEAGPGGPSR